MSSMEKQAKPKNKILKFLPRAASAVNFRSQLPFSPGRDKRADGANKLVKAHASKGFSGPIIKMIPDEVRRKPKNQGGVGGSFENQEEPTSPKVSCIGQIKHKKKMSKSMSMRNTTSHQETKAAKVVLVKKKKKQESSSSAVGGLFIRSNKKPADGRKSDASRYDKPPLPDRPPALGQMRRFASGRDTFANFDWTVQIAPEESDPYHRRRDYFSDDDEEGSVEMEDQEEDEGFIIPFSAPLPLGGEGALEPRKEINLWKRRTTNPPKPLQLNSTVTAK